MRRSERVRERVRGGEGEEGGEKRERGEKQRYEDALEIILRRIDI